MRRAKRLSRPMKAKHKFVFPAVQFPPLLAAGIALLLPSTALSQTQALDFGDAPSPYPTTLKDNGAYHTIAGPKLGSLVDSESDGQPTTAADGDDKNPIGAADDEDGVAFLTPLVPGQTAQVQIVFGGKFDRAFLDAWIDFGIDGSWADVGDQIFAGQTVTLGTQTFTFSVPSTAKLGTTYARFRINSREKLGFRGPAPDGEVEDYMVTISRRLLDFGDAPVPYPTTLKDNGARHSPGGPRLGTQLDTEEDGQPDANALGDDNSPPGNKDDEDGVVFLTALSPGKEAQVQITTSGSFDRALIDAWIDFDANGSWAQSGEQIFISKSVAPGVNLLSFTVPENAKIGTTFARFRISINGKLNFTGEADNGEVEDYAVAISQPLYDYGDAPYKYPTTLADNGARHAITNSFCLGAVIDAEPDGQPDANALGDDNNPPGDADDEDGVTFLTSLEPGKTASIRVYLTAPGTAAPGRGYLDAWIDFNLNQSWTDAGEQICTNYLIYAGNNVINFTVPSSATPGTTYARFRLSKQGLTSPTGYSPDGEVEDYMVTVTRPRYDFGDAPSPYPTTLKDNGARHTPAGPRLGPQLDAEEDGQPDPEALGDDKNPPDLPDDEDGVVFMTPLYAGQQAQVQITASGSFDRALIDAWIDFNANGSWADAGEQIFTSQSVTAGVNLLAFTVPASAKAGQTFARFRISMYGKLSFVGEASNGEVEDYKVNIEQPFDFGDAPAPYPTLLKDNGARHTYVRDHNLGQRIDLEPDGQPSAAADGDDTHPTPDADDEDGVVFPSPVVAGRTATVQVTASRAGRLYAWIDFNRNGSWADPGEKIFAGTALVAGPNTLTFNVPQNAVTGRTYSRWRFTVQGSDLDFVGLAPDGEVEDHLVSIITDRERCDLGCIGREFWLAFPGNYAPDPANPPRLSLHVHGLPGTTGKVIIDSLGFSTNFTIPASRMAVVQLPRQVELGDSNDEITKKGVYLIASDDVGVTAFNHARYTTDSYQALHTSVIGTRYVVMAYGNVLTDVPLLNGTQFAIAAAEPDTVVTIIPSVTTGVHPAHVPYELLMQPGETYQLRNTDEAPADLTGTLIKSDKPIAVFGSHLCTSVSSSNFWYCDHLVEQLLPVNTWGNDFYTAPLATRSGGDVFRVLAAYNATTITVNGVAVANLNGGQFHQMSLTAASRISASKPVLVAQFANSSDYDGVVNADPFMSQVQAVRHYTTAYLFSTPTNDFPTNYLQIISPTAAAGSVRLDGVVIGAPSFSAIPGTTYSFARVPVTAGSHIVSGDQPFAASVYGWAEYDSYGHPACFYFGDVAGPQIAPATSAFTDSVNNYPNTPGQAPVPSITAGAQITDNCSPEVGKPTQDPPPGTLLGPGVHKLTIASTDLTGNEGEATVLFTVLDPSPVVITCPKDIVVNCTTNGGAFVEFTVTARTTYDTNVAVVSTPSSGSFFPAGATTVTNVATSLAGQSNTCYFTVTVVCEKLVRTKLTPSGIELTWPGKGTLLRASTLGGAWTPVVSNVTSYIVVPAGRESYFRVRY